MQYNMRANGYDFTNNMREEARVSMAVASARTGQLVLETADYTFLNNRREEARLLMALETAKTGNLTLEGWGYNFLNNMREEARITIMAEAIKKSQEHTQDDLKSKGLRGKKDDITPDRYGLYLYI